MLSVEARIRKLWFRQWNIIQPLKNKVDLHSPERMVRVYFYVRKLIMKQYVYRTILFFIRKKRVFMYMYKCVCVCVCVCVSV